MFGVGKAVRRRKKEQAKDRTKRKRETTILTSFTQAGTVMAVPVDTPTAARYLELHEIIPDSLPSWPEGELDELLDDFDTSDLDACQRTLVLLAHHKSARAVMLLQELLVELPTDLANFGELAYAEAVGWLGYNYVRERGRPPVIEASAMTPSG